MTIDVGIWYRSARERLTGLVSASGVDPGGAVPATPLWNVHDVVAHVVGVCADGTSGNMAGAPGDEWTAAQVARSAGKPIADLVAEWSHTGPMMEAFLSSPAGQKASAAVLDIHTHEADLRHALGLPAAVPSDVLVWAGEMMSGAFVGQVAGAGLPPVELDIDDLEWFRGRLGRRTEAEVRAYPWSADPSPYLDAFFVFGRAERSLGESV